MGTHGPLRGRRRNREGGHGFLVKLHVGLWGGGQLCGGKAATPTQFTKLKKKEGHDCVESSISVGKKRGEY